METMVQEKPLAPVEQARLRELETIIKDNFLAYVAVGNALLEIRENRLYRTTEGRTWEGYCRELWDMSHQRADQLIAAKLVTDNLTTIVVKGDGEIDWEMLPANEAQARELARLQPEEQQQVWQQLIAEQTDQAEGERPKITAKAVKKAVREIKGEPPKRLAQKLEDALQRRLDAEPGRQSEAFGIAWAELVAQVEAERGLRWRDTSRRVVFNALVELAAKIGGEKSMHARKLTFRPNNLEKLVAAGWSVLRKGGDHRIEMMDNDGGWVVYAEYETMEQRDDDFADALLEPNSIHA
jgi:hypothetical protein